MPFNGREDDPSFRLQEAGDFGRRPPPRGLFPVRRFSARPGPMVTGRAAKPYTLRQLSLRAPRRGNGCGENLKSLDVSAILVINKE